MLVGVAFGVAGAVFQTMLRNPLASPDVIGVTIGRQRRGRHRDRRSSVPAGLSLRGFSMVGSVAVALVIAPARPPWRGRRAPAGPGRHRHRRDAPRRDLVPAHPLRHPRGDRGAGVAQRLTEQQHVGPGPAARRAPAGAAARHRRGRPPAARASSSATTPRPASASTSAGAGWPCCCSAARWPRPAPPPPVRWPSWRSCPARSPGGCCAAASRSWPRPSSAPRSCWRRSSSRPTPCPAPPCPSAS